MNNIIELIKSLGFPIILSFYLLMRIEKKLELLSNLIIEVNDKLSVIEEFNSSKKKIQHKKKTNNPINIVNEKDIV